MNLSTFNKIKMSNAWDSRYNLPTIPIHNNPWIYLAYVVLILKFNNERRAINIMRPDLNKFLEGCQLEPGLIDRWPDGTGGQTSHDEIMGAAYLFPEFAKDALKVLAWNAGFYDNKEEEHQIYRTQYRFPFLVPFLKACAGIRPSLFEQLLWCGHVIHQCNKKKLDDGGLLKTVLMADVMESFLLCRLAYMYWKSKVRKSGRKGLKDLYKYYLSEVPVLHEVSIDRF